MACGRRDFDPIQSIPTLLFQIQMQATRMFMHSDRLSLADLSDLGPI